MKVEVRRSDVHGLGVFATADIEEGEEIGVYEGLVVQGTSDHPRYMGMQDDDESPWGIIGTGLMSYVNASADGENVALDAWVTALRDIKAGEELLADYEFEEDE